jgi:hypothetical protein
LFSYIHDFFENLSTWMSNACFDPTVLVLFSTVLAGFISITVPVALSIVSRHTDEYKDKEISESFLQEPTYRFQIIVVPFFVVFAIILFGLKVNHGWPVYLAITLNIMSFVVFVKFLRIVGIYATNFDDYYITKLKDEADEVIQE